MDIAKFFDVKSSKKRVLSSEQSETGDEPKKQKEGSRNESSTSTLDDVFAEGLKNPDCVLILANCLRSLEQQVKERSSRPDVFCKKGVIRNFPKFIGKHLCQSFFFNNRPATLLKKRLWHRSYPVNFGKFLRVRFFIKHLWTTASLYSFCSD